MFGLGFLGVPGFGISFLIGKKQTNKNQKQEDEQPKQAKNLLCFL